MPWLISYLKNSFFLLRRERGRGRKRRGREGEEKGRVRERKGGRDSERERDFPDLRLS